MENVLVLRVAADGVAKNMHVCLDNLPTEWDWDVELCQLSERGLPVVAPFRGGIVYVEKCGVTVPLWRRSR